MKIQTPSYPVARNRTRGQQQGLSREGVSEVYERERERREWQCSVPHLLLLQQNPLVLTQQGMALVFVLPLLLLGSHFHNQN